MAQRMMRACPLAEAEGLSEKVSSLRREFMMENKKPALQTTGITFQLEEKAMGGWAWQVQAFSECLLVRAASVLDPCENDIACCLPVLEPLSGGSHCSLALKQPSFPLYRSVFCVCWEGLGIKFSFPLCDHFFNISAEKECLLFYAFQPVYLKGFSVVFHNFHEMNFFLDSWN